MYTIQALWTHARESLNVTTVIFANRRYELLKQELSNVGATPGRARSTCSISIAPNSISWRWRTAWAVTAQRVDCVRALGLAVAGGGHRTGPESDRGAGVSERALVSIDPRG